ncbi:PREDICTED: stromal cell-derived factor 2 [Pseudopodoces humilis]|nr:PREDICTED: stromal cell-derived factor 2 [Pseudopodoces humilis]
MDISCSLCECQRFPAAPAPLQQGAGAAAPPGPGGATLTPGHRLASSGPCPPPPREAPAAASPTHDHRRGGRRRFTPAPGPAAQPGTNLGDVPAAFTGARSRRRGAGSGVTPGPRQTRARPSPSKGPPFPATAALAGPSAALPEGPKENGGGGGGGGERGGRSGCGCEAAVRPPLLLPLLLPLLAALGAAGRGGPGPVTCGSVVKLLNVRHNVRLHSHDVRYGSGSGQQSVTGVSAADDGNSYWRVRGRTAAVCQRGTPVRCGQAIRLTHLGTGRNLHSHRFTSPLSGNQEVSAFGEAGEGDYLDDWTVVCSGTYWVRDDEVRFQHTSTDVFLSVTGEQYGRPIHGQKEVHGMATSSQNNYWKVMEGIFMQPSEALQMEQYHAEL